MRHTIGRAERSCLPLLIVLACAACQGCADPKAHAAASDPHKAGTALHRALFHRFVEHVDPENRSIENKQYLGEVMQNVLFAPRTTPRLLKEVDDAGCVTLDPEKDLPKLSDDALGFRTRMKYQGRSMLLSGAKRTRYRFVPREDLAQGPVRLEPAGRPTPHAEIWAREVLPVARRYTSDAISIPEAAWLDASLGLQQDWRLDTNTRVRFRVEVEVNGQWSTVHDQVLSLSPGWDKPAWTQIHVNLAEFGGCFARFAFVSEAVEGTPEPNFAFPLWGNPVLYSSNRQAPSGAPSVILISLDTLRPDHVGCCGYHRNTTPNLDRFAEDCALFETAIAAAPWTTPSHASVFTGLHPAEHGAGVFSRGYSLAPQWRTLAEIAQRNGYLTAAFTEGICIRGRLGFAQGFDVYSDGPAPDRHRAGNVEATFAAAGAWLDSYAHLPFFLFVHTYEIHEPYGAPEPWKSRFADRARPGSPGNVAKDARTAADRVHTVDLYDAGIAYTDHHLGRLFERLDALKLLANTVVVVFSDHGEEFWEHGATGHMTHAYDETLRALLLIRLPGESPPHPRVKRQVALLDVFPTLLDLLGLATPHASAQSLMPLMTPGTGAAPYERAFVMSELARYDEQTENATGAINEWTTRTVRAENEKYLVSNRAWVLDTLRNGRSLEGAGPPVLHEEVYDLAADPKEQHNLAHEKPGRAAHFRSIQETFLDRISAGDATRKPPDPAQCGLTDEDIESLRCLGYLWGQGAFK